MEGELDSFKVHSNYTMLNGNSVTVASGAILHVHDTLPNAALSNLPTTSNLVTKVTHGTGPNSVIWHDGSGWYEAGATSFTP